MPLLISILGFVIFLLIVFLLYTFLHTENITVNERIEKILQSGQHNEDKEIEIKNIAAPPNEEIWRRSVQSLSGYFDKTNFAKMMENKLVQADLKLRGSEFVVITIFSMLAFMSIFLLLSSGKIILGIIGLFLGYIIPIIVVKVKIAQRIKAIDAQIADALVLISSSLRSGYSFMQAIELAGREMAPPISVEFHRVLREINLGVTTNDAMNHMAERINSEDLDMVVTAVLIQRQVGGNLAEILDNISTTIRERVKIRGHIKTLTAQGRLTGIIISLLPVGLCGVIYMINPGYIVPLFTQAAGQVLLASGIFMEFIGILLIRNIVDIKV